MHTIFTGREHGIIIFTWLIGRQNILIFGTMLFDICQVHFPLSC